MTVIQLALLTVWTCFINAIALPIRQDYYEGGIVTVISNGLGSNYIIWGAILLGTQRLWTSQKIRNNNDFLWLLLPAIILQLIPFASVAWVSASYAALIIIAFFPRKTLENLASTLIFCAMLREPTINIFLKVFGQSILSFDAYLASITLNLMGYNNQLHSNIVAVDGGLPLLILTGCSAFTNLSFISLLWILVHVVIGQRKLVKPIQSLSALIVLCISINSIRLALMTFSIADYQFYHDGDGASYFQLLLFSLAFLFSYMRCHYATHESTIFSPSFRK